ncbi:MAG: ribose 5-phosphate isomerase B [Clostridia bacterium]|nr:ribose 5-phosphate isomerase B [Clostridia bacterium]
MVVLGCDKAGTEWLPILSEKLNEMGVENKIIYDGTVDGCDYTDAAFLVAETVAKGEAEKGILVCGTGIGMSMAANKVRGIRASVCNDCYSAKMTVVHNNSNILCMGARVLGIELALKITEEYFSAEFEAGGRHERRVNAIIAKENEQLR